MYNKSYYQKYQKYIKYKNKYQKLKEQYGGVLGTDVCPIPFPQIEILECLIRYKCNFNDLVKNIPEKIKEFNYCEFVTDNEKNSQKITVNDLKRRDFPVYFLKSKNFPLAKLKEAEYNVMQLKRYYTVKELKDVGFTLYRLYKFGINIIELYRANFTEVDFQQAGFGVKDINEIIIDGKIIHVKITKDDFINIKNIYPDYSYDKKLLAGFLKAKGFDIIKLKDIGINIYNISEVFSHEELKETYNIRQLLDLGFEMNDLIKVFPLIKFKQENIEVINFKILNNFNIKELIEAGYTVQELICTKFGANLLKNIFTALELRNFGYTLIQLKDNFDIIALKEAGFSAKELKEVGFNIRKLKEAGFNINELFDLGFNLIELKVVGFTLNDFKQIKINQSDILSLGFSARELKNEKYTIEQLLKEEYCANQLKNAGFTEKELNINILKQHGYSAIELICAQYDINDLLKIGYTQEDVSNANFLVSNKSKISIDKLDKHKYSKQELEDSGYFEKDGEYYMAYIDDSLIMFRHRKQISIINQVKSTFKVDPRIDFFNHEYAILKFYSLLKDYVYKMYGNHENIDNLKKNWKIHLPTYAGQFNEQYFNQVNRSKRSSKPDGLWGSELYPSNCCKTWIEYLIDIDGWKKLQRVNPGNLIGFLIFRLKDSDKILNVIDYTTDIEKYKSGWSNGEGNLYNWEEISKKYYAINAPSIFASWDVASTVIWNVNAVEEYKFIKLDDLPFKKNFINSQILFNRI